MSDMVDLTTAAQRLGLSSERTRRAVLTWRLVGERRNGHWFIASDSLERYAQELAEKSEDLQRLASEREQWTIDAGAPGDPGKRE